MNTWVVAGISWGVTLGLAYAQRHPDRVLALVLAAVTTGTLQRPTGSPGTRVVCSRASGTGSSSCPRAGTTRRPRSGVQPAASQPRSRCAGGRRVGVVQVGGHARVVGSGLEPEPPLRQCSIPDGVRTPGHPLLESRLLPRRWSAPHGDGSPGCHSRGADPRPPRRIRATRHRMDPAPVRAGQQTRRPRGRTRRRHLSQTSSRMRSTGSATFTSSAPAELSACGAPGRRSSCETSQAGSRRPWRASRG